MISKDPLSEYHLWQPFTQMGTFFNDFSCIIERGEGPYLIDRTGRRYLNMISCLWNAPLGLGQDGIVDAIASQLKQLGYAPIFRAVHQPAIDLAGIVADVTPGNLNRVFLTSNGSESIETGIKMARQYFRLKGMAKHKVISLKNAYHGVSYGAMTASGLPEDREFFAPVPGGFLQIAAPACYRCELGLTHPDCRLACADLLEKAILAEGPDQVALFLMEPVMGVAGTIVPPPGYLARVAEVCRKYEVLLMLDEVTTGFGRTGKMFACEHENVVPDILALGKAMSAGYFPLGATVATDEVFEEFLGDDNKRRFGHGSTYSGHPGGCAAGIATINMITESNVVETACQRGAFFFEQLQQLRELPIVGDVRGKGMMFGIEFVADKELKTPFGEAEMQKIMIACFAAGLFVHLSGNCILMLPPFIMDEELLLDAAARFHRAVTKAQHWL